MELFVIQCTTCRARLKVHDPAVIGQIIECPKCRSFVAVTAPSDWQSPAKEASPAVTSPTSTGNPPAAPAVSASGILSRTAPDRSAAAGAKAAAAASALPARGTPPPLPKKSGSSLAGISSSGFIKPNQGASAPSAGRAAAAVGAWAPPGSQPAPPTNPSAQPAASMASADPVKVVGANGLRASIAAALVGRNRWWIVGAAAGIVAVASAAWVLGRSHDTTPPADPVAVIDRAAEPTPGEKIEVDPATTEPRPNIPAAEPATAVTPAAVPVGGDHVPVASDPRSGAENPAGTEAHTAPASPPTLSANDEKLVGAETAADVAPLVPGSYGTGGKTPETSTGPAGTTTTAMDDGSDEGKPFDPVKQVRLMTHLQDKLPALEFSGVPLGQFVIFLSEFSTVPMVIDTQALVDAGKSAKTRINVKLDDATVEEALKAALDKPGLTYHIEPGRLVITPRSAKSK